MSRTNKQIGYFAFHFWSSTDVMKRAKDNLFYIDHIICIISKIFFKLMINFCPLLAFKKILEDYFCHLQKPHKFHTPKCETTKPY